MTITYKILRSDFPEFMEYRNGCNFSVIYKNYGEKYFSRYFIVNDFTKSIGNLRIPEELLMKYNEIQDESTEKFISNIEKNYIIECEQDDTLELIDIIKISNNLWYSKTLNSRIEYENSELLIDINSDIEDNPKDNQLIGLFYRGYSEFPNNFIKKLKKIIGIPEKTITKIFDNCWFCFNVYRETDDIFYIEKETKILKCSMEDPNIVIESLDLDLDLDESNFLGSFNWDSKKSFYEFENNLLNIIRPQETGKIYEFKYI